MNNFDICVEPRLHLAKHYSDKLKIEFVCNGKTTNIEKMLVGKSVRSRMNS